MTTPTWTSEMLRIAKKSNANTIVLFVDGDSIGLNATGVLTMAQLEAMLELLVQSIEQAQSFTTTVEQA